MTKYDLLRELMQQLDAYEDQLPEGALTSMAGFLDYASKSSREAPAIGPGLGTGMADSKEIMIARLFTQMYRYAKSYFKVALEKTPLQTIDELVFLIILLAEGPLGKSELIKKALIEKTTGMEVLKRMINKGFLHETIHPEDKRARLVSITNAGQGIIFGSFGDIRRVSEIINGNLTEEEKDQLLVLLNKLDLFHRDIAEREMQRTTLALG